MRELRYFISKRTYERASTPIILHSYIPHGLWLRGGGSVLEENTYPPLT